MKVVVREVHTDDWHVIYLNNKNIFEDHGVDIHSIIEEIQNLIELNSDTITSIESEYYYVDERYAEEFGFPDNFSDFPDGVLE